MAYQFDHDTGENCMERAEAGACVQDDTTFYDCAHSCTKKYHREYDPDEAAEENGRVYYANFFYSIQIPLLESSTSNKKKKNVLKFERFEDYLVVVAVVPIVPGMAQYMYDMLHHLQKTFPILLEIVLVPMLEQDDKKNDDEAEEEMAKEEETTTTNTTTNTTTTTKRSAAELLQQYLVPKPHSKIFITEPFVHRNNFIAYLNHPILNHLTKNALHARDRELDRDRVTAFVVSINARIIERIEQPTLVQLDRYIAHYAHELDVKEL